MIVDCVSDLHGYEPKLLGGDLLLLAGDYTASDEITEWVKFFQWLKRQNYKKKILIAGNHDGFLECKFPKNKKEFDIMKKLKYISLEEQKIDTEDFEYLCDSVTFFEKLKIWGTPWTNWFHGVHPKCKSFMKNESKLESKFEKIPSDIDILITHSPPYMILDENKNGQFCGSTQLRYQIDIRVSPKFHIFGHIHEQHGKQALFKRPGVGFDKNTNCFNVSYVDENYKPIGKVIRLEM